MRIQNIGYMDASSCGFGLRRNSLLMILRISPTVSALLKSVDR